MDSFLVLHEVQQLAPDLPGLLELLKKAANRCSGLRGHTKVLPLSPLSPPPYHVIPLQVQPDSSILKKWGSMILTLCDQVKRVGILLSLQGTSTFPQKVVFAVLLF